MKKIVLGIGMILVCLSLASAITWKSNGTETMSLDDFGNLNVSGNVTTSGTGFFGWLGSLTSRITKLFVQDVNINGTLNLSGDLIVDNSDLFIDVSTGRVGIGTSSPEYELDVSGTNAVIKVSASNDNNQERVLLWAATDGGAIDLFNSSESNTVKIRGYASDGVQAYFTAGNIGIGTESPSNLLHVYSSGDGSQNARLLTVEGTDSQFGIKKGNDIWGLTNWDKQLIFQYYNGSNFNRVTFADSGKVGIGTKTPDGFLHLESSGLDAIDASDSGQYSMIIHGKNGADGDEIGLGFSIFGGSNPLDSNHSPGAAITLERTGGWSAGKLHFKTRSSILETGNPVTRMTIDEDGDIYSVPWTDYSGDTTTVGWSSFTTKRIYYKKIGNLVFINFNLKGTSDDTVATFTLPYTSTNSADYETRVLIPVMDNSVQLNTPGLVLLEPNSNIAQSFTTIGEAPFTNSAQKRVQGQFWYEAQ